MSQKRILIIMLSLLLCVLLLVTGRSLLEKYKWHIIKEYQQQEYEEKIKRLNELFRKDRIDVVEREDFGILRDRSKYNQRDADIISEAIKPIDSNETAIEVGKAILEKYHEKGYLPDYFLWEIVHYIDDNAWRYDYSIDRENKIVLGGWYYVLIDGNEGTLVNAWIGE